MTSSDPQQPGDDPTVIRPSEPAPSGPDLTKRDSGAGYGGDADAATTIHNTTQPDPYASPSNPYAPYSAPADPYAANPYAAPSDPYAAPSDPYASASNPYAAQSDPYGAPPQYPGQPGGFPGYPGQNLPGYPAPGYPAQQPTTNGLAIAALVCGIVAFPLGCLYGVGIAAAIAALVMGIISMKQVKQTGQPGHGMALAGTILGGVFIALFVIAIVIIIVIAATGDFDTVLLPFG